MNYIQNTIILQNGDILFIVEAASLSAPNKLMYKIEHETEKIVLDKEDGKFILPVENILFATSLPVEIDEEDRTYEIKLRN